MDAQRACGSSERDLGGPRIHAGEMERAFPDASVEGYQDHIGTPSLPDPDDRHVLAAAIEVGAGRVPGIFGAVRRPEPALFGVCPLTYGRSMDDEKPHDR